MQGNRTNPTQAGKEAAPSMVRRLLTGLFYILLGLGTRYWYLIRPVHQAQLTGSAEYHPTAVIAVPCLICGGIGLIGTTLFGNLATRSVDANGRSRLNATGVVFFLGFLGSIVGLLAWWIHFTHSAGVVTH